MNTNNKSTPPLSLSLPLSFEYSAIDRPWNGEQQSPSQNHQGSFFPTSSPVDPSLGSSDSRAFQLQFSYAQFL